MPNLQNYLKKSQKVNVKELLSILHRGMGRVSSYLTWHLRGFWANTQQKKLSWLRILQIWLLTLVVGFEIWLVRTRTKIYFQMYRCRRTLSQRPVGVRTLMASILLLVWGVPWLVVVPTYSLLTTLTRSKTLS